MAEFVGGFVQLLPDPRILTWFQKSEQFGGKGFRSKFVLDQFVCHSFTGDQVYQSEMFDIDQWAKKFVVDR